MHPKNLLYAAAAILLAIALYLHWLWQPERQVARHQENFLKALSSRSWQDAAAFLAPDYTDRWDHDRESALRDCRIVLAQFSSLEIRQEGVATSMQPGSGTVTARLALEGSGNEFAMLAVQRTRQLTTPFVFTWKKSGSKPWEWSLIHVDNAGLEFRGFDL